MAVTLSGQESLKQGSNKLLKTKHWVYSRISQGLSFLFFKDLATHLLTLNLAEREKKKRDQIL